MATGDETDPLAQLLAVAPAAFVAERRRLADALKAAGRAAEAKEILKIAKPSVPVWVINQLARRQAPLIEQLIALTAELRHAPLSSQRPRNDTGAVAATSGYARALGAHRDTLKALREAAGKILAQAGYGANPQVMERVVHSLRAGAADEEARAAIRAARLLREVGEQDFASLVGPLVANYQAPAVGERAGHPATAGRRDDEGDGESRRANAHGPEHPRRDDADAGTKQRARGDAARAKQLAHEAATRERERARAQEAAAREQARARAAAQRTIERLRAQLDAAHKRVAQEERALAAAREALAASEREADTARRAAEALARALDAAESSARALGTS